jgi:HK97 family phage portal protein
VASRDVALSYARNRLRGSAALQQLARPALPGRLTRQALLTLTTTDPPLIPTVQPATESDALGYPPFGRAVALLANAAASTEWYARRFDRDLGIAIPLPDQPSIVTDPDPLSTLWGYRWAAAEDGILYGNHVALKGDLDWRTGRPGWLVPLPVDQVWLQVDPDGTYAWVIGGITLSPDEVFHVSFGARSGQLLGRGVLQQYADSLAGDLAAESYSRDTFAAGALPPAVIAAGGVVKQEQADELKQKWRDIVLTREPVVLPSGTTLLPIVGNAEQAQLVDARKWNAHMTANAVGVPPWKLGLDGPTMTYQNVETGDIDFVRDSADRWMRPLTEAMTKWLMPGGTSVVWDYDSRMRADAKSTMEILTGYAGAGVFTVDEIRAKLGYPPLPTPAQTARRPETTDQTADDVVAAAQQIITQTNLQAIGATANV